MKCTTTCCSGRNSQDGESDSSRSSSNMTEVEYSGDENKDRGNWSRPLDLLLSIVSYSVGLGNVWRFPYLCYRNGGGAFLIPYIISLFVAGLPLFYMEMSIGQYASRGVTGVWKLSPIFKGVGYSMVFVTGVIEVYYNIIISYVLFYTFASMTSRLPWTTCDNDWNTPACTVRTSAHDDQQGNYTLGNVSSVVETNVMGVLNNITGYAVVDDIKVPSLSNFTTNVTLVPKSPAEEYFENHVLGLSSGIDEPGEIRWPLVGCLALSWVIVFLCLFKGIKSSGKVVYFTATFPYLVLTILLVRGVTLPGSLDGLKFYFIPDFEKLKSARVWGDAAAQIFFSLGPGWGPILSYASFNKFHTNCRFFSIASSIICSFTSLFAGAVIFSIIGFMAHQLQVSIGEVVASGPGLAFVVYPEAVGHMPIAPLWALMFFCMLLTVSIGSSFASLQAVLSAIFDEFPNYLAKTQKRKLLVTGIICFCYFLLGLPQTTQGGIYILNLIDGLIGTFTILIIVFFEIIAVIYVYGVNNLSDNIEAMLGIRPGIYLRVCWRFVVPVVTICILISNSIHYQQVTYNSYTYPMWAQVMGWLMVCANIGCIPTGMIYCLVCRAGGFVAFLKCLRLPWTGQLLRDVSKPAEDWGPALPQYQQVVEQMMKDKYGIPPKSRPEFVPLSVTEKTEKTANGFANENAKAAEAASMLVDSNV